MHKIVLTLIVLSFSLTVIGQENCAALVNARLETVHTACNATGRNTLCYGSDTVTAVPYEHVEGFNFAQAGDVVGIADVQSLQLSPMNLNDETWGVALMTLQANLPATTPDQNVTALLFGDVEIENMGSTVQIEARVGAPNPVNVRSIPSTQGAIVAVLDQNTLLTLNGRTNTGDWLRIQLDDGGKGWLAAYLVQADADVSSLSVVDDDTPTYASMQAFTLKTGMGDASCAGTPNSGLLIQSPEGAGEINLKINGVDITLKGTAFVQANPESGLLVSILEGNGTLSALDKTITVPAGAASSALVDANLMVSDPPIKPISYTLENLTALPVSLLPRQIEIIEPLEFRNIVALTGCRVMSSSEDVNFRQGPATAYFATGTLTANTPYRVSGQTVGGDGFKWWHTARGWVRADIVTTIGNCDDVVYTDARPEQPSTSGVSTGLDCTSERVIYARVGDTVRITDSYYSSEVHVGDIIGTLFVDGKIVYQGNGTQSGSGITWSTSWQATAGIHNVEMQYNPTVEIKPDYAKEPWKPGETGSHKVCQIRVE